MFKTRSGPDHGAQHLEHRSTLASSLVTQASLPRIAVRSDLWSLGVTLYELLTGECPFSGSAISVILDILRKAPRPPRRLDPSIPKDLEAICLKCLAKAPAQRYGTCADLADDLRRWLQGGPTAARPLPAAERGWRWSKRNPVFALCLVLLIGGLVTAVAYLAQTRPLHVGQDVMQTHDPQTKESALSAHGGWSASNGAPSRELGLTPAPFAKSEPGLPPIPTQPVNEQKSRNADVPPQKDEITVIIDRDLEYIPDRWPVGESYDLAPDLLRRPDKALVGEPQYRSREVWYGYLSFGNGPNSRFSYAIDGWDSGHWMMYVDKNRNQDLTDDGSPVSSDAVDQGVVLDLPVPVASVSGMAKTRPYRLWLRINTRDGKMTPEFCPRCHYRGQLVVQGKSYAVATVDRGNSHLDFTTADAFCSEHGLWIDVDGNGQFDPLMENFLDGEAIRIGNKDYVLRLFETDDGQLGLNDDSSPQMPAPIHVAIDRDLTYLPQGRSALTQSTIMKSSSPPGPVPVLTLIKEPVFKSQQVLYGNLTLGDGPLDSVRYVLDELESPTGAVYIDKNNNRDLTDDGPPLRTDRSDSRRGVPYQVGKDGRMEAVADRRKIDVTALVDVPLASASGVPKSRPYHFDFSVDVDAKKVFVHWHNTCAYRGILLVRGKPYVALACDDDVNGLFSDNGLWLDLNHDSKFKRETEHFSAGATLTIDGQQFLLNLQETRG